jgi:hypothetical protein
MDSVIRRLNESGARYIAIGGQAVRLHGLPRFSLDWDFFIPPHDIENFRRIERALDGELDVDLSPLGPRGENLIQTYQTRWGVLQFHLAVPGLATFEDAERASVWLVNEDGEAVRCVSARDLLASKRASNRPQDQQDIAYLIELLREEEG